MKVLIVDDSKTMRTIIKNALKKGNHENVAEAENGKEAVSTVMSDEINLILMDWNMPEMSGLDAVKAIRASGNQTPIVMVTTEAEKHRIMEAVQAGIND